jgi:hypothetical protein
MLERCSQPHDPLEREASSLETTGMKSSRKPPAQRRALPSRFAATDGRALPELGHDFAAVRVHDDGPSHRLAASYGASAFTYGTDIFLGAGPHDRSVLAHELVHTTQNTGDVVHRRVTPRYAELQRNLVGPSFFGLGITDAQAHSALVILDRLNDRDMTDTVEAMERDNLVDNLFDNVSENDRGTFEDTLQRVQDNRVHVRTRPDGTTVTTRDSCTPEQRDAMATAGNTAMGWLDDALAELRYFISVQPPPGTQALPPTPRMQGVLDNLQRNFHTDNVFHAQLLESRLALVRQQFANGAIVQRCLAPTETFCTGFGTPAYVTYSAHRMNFCPSFFTEWSAYMQANIILHESMHALLTKVQPASGGAPNVVDRAYSSERVYQHLRPEEAFDNAESYARFTREVPLGPDPQQTTWRQLVAPLLGRPSRDVYAGCDAVQTPAVSAAVARAERLNTDARNVVSGESPEDLARWEDLRVRYFGRIDRARTREITEAFHEIDEGLDWAVSTSCVTTACPASGTVNPTGRILEVCPGFFAQPEPARIRAMYTALFMQIRGMTAAQAAPFVNLAVDAAASRGTAPPPLPQNNPWTAPMRPGEMLA